MTDLQQEMQTLHERLTRTREQLNELKRKTARGPVDDYTLRDDDGNEVPLSSLFGDHDDLIVVQNMGLSCPYCTLWADGFDGVLGHLQNRAAFVVVSPDRPAEQQKFAADRGWRFALLSSEGSKFKRDLGFESEGGDQMPGVSTFRRDGDQVVNVANDYFGPGDAYCSVWHFFDLLADGAAGWTPQYRY